MKNRILLVPPPPNLKIHKFASSQLRWKHCFFEGTVFELCEMLVSDILLIWSVLKKPNQGFWAQVHHELGFHDMEIEYGDFTGYHSILNIWLSIPMWWARNTRDLFLGGFPFSDRFLLVSSVGWLHTYQSLIRSSWFRFVLSGWKPCVPFSHS